MLNSKMEKSHVLQNSKILASNHWQSILSQSPSHYQPIRSRVYFANLTKLISKLLIIDECQHFSTVLEPSHCFAC